VRRLVGSDAIAGNRHRRFLSRLVSCHKSHGEIGACRYLQKQWRNGQASQQRYSKPSTPAPIGREHITQVQRISRRSRMVAGTRRDEAEDGRKARSSRCGTCGARTDAVGPNEETVRARGGDRACLRRASPVAETQRNSVPRSAWELEMVSPWPSRAMANPTEERMSLMTRWQNY